MRIAIVGTGISGLVTAWLLHDEHEITVFEANDYIGGHTHTVDVDLPSGPLRVDTGFIVHNDRTYPNFIELLERIGVERQKSPMSFSVRCERTGLEYCGSSLNALFAQRRNFFRPRFHRMLRDITRFNRESREALDGSSPDVTLGAFLSKGDYGADMIDKYLVPMGAAIWSAGSEQMREFPARAFISFFSNHGLLDLKNRPQWYTIARGSQSYVDVLIKPFANRIRLSSPVESIRRDAAAVHVKARGADEETFDHVVIAAHSDQALSMLADPSGAERDILGAIPYTRNEIVLHTGESLLPRARLAWAAWNYHILREDAAQAVVTYNMNILQQFDCPETLCVSLNHPDAPTGERRLGEYIYHHPVYTSDSLRAQSRRDEISGVNRTHYCGAYWRHGFHEDGVVSALAVGQFFGKGL